MGARHRPGVTLIFHEPLYEGDCAASSILLQFDASQQRRGVRERNYFREKTTNLNFRIEAALEAAKELDDVVCSDQDGRVGLLRIHGVDVLDRDWADLRKSRRRGKRDSTLVGFDGPRGAQVFEQKSNKARIGGGVEQAAFARPSTHGGERAWILSLGVKPGPFDGQWQQIICGFALSLGLEQHNSQIGIGGSDWYRADDMGRRLPPSICIPAPARKKCRKNVAFEYRFG